MIELRNIGHVSLLIVESARLRKESRGLHFCLDYPDKSNDFLHWTVLKRRHDGKPWEFSVKKLPFILAPTDSEVR